MFYETSAKTCYEVGIWQTLCHFLEWVPKQLYMSVKFYYHMEKYTVKQKMIYFNVKLSIMEKLCLAHFALFN